VCLCLSVCTGALPTRQCVWVCLRMCGQEGHQTTVPGGQGSPAKWACCATGLHSSPPTVLLPLLLLPLLLPRCVAVYAGGRGCPPAGHLPRLALSEPEEPEGPPGMAPQVHRLCSTPRPCHNHAPQMIHVDPRPDTHTTGCQVLVPVAQAPALYASPPLPPRFSHVHVLRPHMCTCWESTQPSLQDSSTTTGRLTKAWARSNPQPTGVSALQHHTPCWASPVHHIMATPPPCMFQQRLHSVACSGSHTRLYHTCTSCAAVGRANGKESRHKPPAVLCIHTHLTPAALPSPVHCLSTLCTACIPRGGT
jgi:hypothetical protein